MSGRGQVGVSSDTHHSWECEEQGLALTGDNGESYLGSCWCSMGAESRKRDGGQVGKWTTDPAHTGGTEG